MQCNDDRYDDDQNDKQATSPHILQQSASFVCSQILTFFEIWLPTEILSLPQIYPLVTCWLLFKVKKWWDVRVLTEEMCLFVVNCIGQCLCAALISPCSSNKIEAISIEIQSQYQFKCGESKIAWICCWLCSHHDVRVLLMTSLLFDRLFWRIGILSVVAFFSPLQSPLRVMLQSDSFTEEGLCSVS